MVPDVQDRVAPVEAAGVPAAFFALARLGAVQVPLNPFLKGEFLRYQLADSGATVLIGDAAALGHVGALADRLPALRTLIAVGHTPDPPDGALGFDDLLAGGPAAPEHPVAMTDLVAVMYTSGTGGLPKGCMLSQGYYLAHRCAPRTCTSPCRAATPPPPPLA